MTEQRLKRGERDADNFAAQPRVGRASEASLMHELLPRLQRALPAMHAWLLELHATHAEAAIPVLALGFGRLAAHFPDAMLKSTHVVTLDVVPFPPVSDLGLPEFEQMASMPMEGITFGPMYFVTPKVKEGVHFHELVHVVQWAELGWSDFLRAYAVGIVERGYPQSPFESLAYELQARFETGEPLPQMLELVRANARQQRTRTAQVFQAHGVSVRRSPSQ